MSHDAVLENVRKLVNGLFEQQSSGAGPNVSPMGQGSPPAADQVDKLGADWCFIDCESLPFNYHDPPSCLMAMIDAGCTAERVFRVDSGQEHLHYITDISSDCLYVLDPTSGLDSDPSG